MSTKERRPDGETGTAQELGTAQHQGSAGVRHATIDERIGAVECALESLCEALATGRLELWELHASIGGAR